ncbi:MAG: response regulator transcription factor [Spirochaetales bacterium]|nr:response regulator transcription factor [Spirochaetales bacterium]
MARVLIVDDDKKFVDSTAEFLSKAGYEVIKATNIGEGKLSAESEKPDIIILDVTLETSEDGLLLGKELHQSGVNMPIIILESVIKAANFNIDISELMVEAYAEKPIVMDKLLSKIKAILER